MKNEARKFSSDFFGLVRATSFTLSAIPARCQSAIRGTFRAARRWPLGGRRLALDRACCTGASA